ncbi:hypothetical protein M9Y10_037684 [Tritrichomonas musculus]|uniref:BZIP domain-containing protein n=1 Tax=Tritrichomonas musculus TaxID=1915356 RepID=A0ABR2GR61_9EUKA
MTERISNFFNKLKHNNESAISMQPEEQAKFNQQVFGSTESCLSPDAKSDSYEKSTESQVSSTDSPKITKNRNEYMKEYRRKKKQEFDERMNKVSLNINQSTKLYNVKDINDILLNYANTFIKICYNSNIMNAELNEKIQNNIDDIYKLSIILQDAVKSII